MSECALHIRGDICMPPEVFQQLLDEAEIDRNTPPKAAKAKLLEAYNVKTESALWDHQDVRKQVPNSDFILDSCYKLCGSHNPQALSNDEIDKTLWQWEIQWPQLCNVGFTMINFATYGGTPEQLLKNFGALYKGAAVTISQPELRVSHAVPASSGKRQFCFVLNSDEIGGAGKHWTCVFVSCASNATIEFFNSSGNAPYPQIIDWLVRAQAALIKSGCCQSAEIVHVTSIRHQKGGTECGVYCLYYIYSRLSGTGHEHFKHHEISDEKMTEFRRTHLFRGA